MKRCSKCKKMMDLKDFYKDGGKEDSLRCDCKKCSAIASKKYRDNNREKVLKQQNKYYLENRHILLAKRYGITPLEYTNMFEHQKGKCAICNTDKCSTGFSLAVDHNHATGKIRGLLCQGCNTSIGKFKDSITLLNRAIKYLREDGVEQ